MIDQGEGAGASGRASLEIDQGTAAQLILPTEFCILDSPQTESGGQTMYTECLLSKALEIELNLLPLLSDRLSHAVQTAIICYAGELQEMLKIDTARECGTSRSDAIMLDAEGVAHKINGNFGNDALRLATVAHDLGISNEACAQGSAWLRKKARSWFGSPPHRTQFDALKYVPQEDIRCLQLWISDHKLFDGTPLQQHIFSLIKSFGMTLFALLPCLFDATQLRVRARTINGAANSMTWTPSDSISSRELLRFLSDLVHGPDTVILENGPAYLAVSADCTTIYYRALFDEQCFDEQGRTLCICPGRITFAGALRNVVVAEHFISPAMDGSRLFTTNTIMPEIGTTRIARDVNIEPLYVDIPVHVEMDVQLKEHTIAVSTDIVSHRPGKEFKKICTSLHACLHSLLLCLVGQPCGHDPMTPLMAKSDTLEIATFLTQGSRKEYFDATSSEKQDRVRFFALKGVPLKQLLQMGILRSNLCREGADQTILQGESCLECALKELKLRREERLENERKRQMYSFAGRVEKESDVFEVVMT